MGNNIKNQIAFRQVYSVLTSCALVKKRSTTLFMDPPLTFDCIKASIS